MLDHRSCDLFDIKSGHANISLRNKKDFDMVRIFEYLIVNMVSDGNFQQQFPASAGRPTKVESMIPRKETLNRGIGR